MLPVTQPGWVVIASLNTSCSANVSLTLICALCHLAGESAAALKTENVPNGPLIRPTHAWDEASVASVMFRTWRVASYHGGPFSRVLTSYHLSVSNHRPLWSDTAIDGKLFRPSERLSAAIWWYMWCVFRLVGGTATDIHVYLPASFSSWVSDILWRSIASRGIASTFSSLSSGRRTCVAPYRNQGLERPGLWWVPVNALERS